MQAGNTGFMARGINFMKNKQMKLINIFTFLIIFTAGIGYTYSPKAGSPLANHTHPRLLITEDMIPELRNILAVHFKTEYQDYVDWAASADVNDDYNILGEAGHDPLRALMVHQAFIAAMGTVPGINYPISLDSFAQKAIDRLINRLEGSDDLSYVAAYTYDWTYNYMTSAERTTAANEMRANKVTHKVFDHSIANPDIEPEQMFSSKYYEGCYAWLMGLALWGDGLIDADADNAVDSFTNTMLNYGYLDAQNFVAGNDGGWSEWIGYSSWHPRTHMLNVASWVTATQEDYFANSGTVDGNAIKSYPSYMRYALDPHKYFDKHYTYVRMGGAETTDPSFEHRSMREQILMLPRFLAHSGLTNEAGLLRDMVDKYDIEWPSYEHFYLWGFIGAYRAYDPVTPEDLNFTESLWARNLGVFFARTGFNSDADGVFAISEGHYRYDGHRGADDFSGFSLVKFGTLVNTRYVAHRGYGNLDNYPGGHPDNTIYFGGGHIISKNSLNTPSDLKGVINSQGDYDHGGIEQVTRKAGIFQHVRINRNLQLEEGTSHTREFVWLPGETPQTDSDLLVIYDRTQSSTQAEFVYHVPWKPTVSNYSSTENITTGSGESDRIGDAYTGNNIVVKELNSLGGERDSDGGDQDYVGGGVAHGVAFVKSILPAQTRVEVTRVAAFDSDVIKRQHHLAIKSHRWQVSVFPKETQNVHRFLNVFQTADENNVTSMTPVNLIEVGNAMQGVWIEKERSGRPNYVVLFSKEHGVNEQVITYSVNGSGTLRHIITGVKPHTIYEIEDIHNSNTTTFNKVTEPDMQLWDYKGAAVNITAGTLYFETTLNGSHTFKLTISGEQDTTSPAAPSGLRLNGNN